jgi:hypothetical protein
VPVWPSLPAVQADYHQVLTRACSLTSQGRSELPKALQLLFLNPQAFQHASTCASVWRHELATANQQWCKGARACASAGRVEGCTTGGPGGGSISCELVMHLRSRPPAGEYGQLVTCNVVACRRTYWNAIDKWCGWWQTGLPRKVFPLLQWKQHLTTLLKRCELPVLPAGAQMHWKAAACASGTVAGLRHDEGRLTSRRPVGILLMLSTPLEGCVAALQLSYIQGWWVGQR